MKRQSIRQILLSLCLMILVPGISYAQDFCWKNSYGRGAGTIPKLTTHGKNILQGGNCKSGFRDMGLFCAKSECTGGKTYQDGLCYKECRVGYRGRGPVCWTSAPTSWVECGMGAAKDDVTCGFVTGGQVVSAVKLGANIATAGGSSAATSATKSADYPKLAALQAELLRLKDLYGPTAQTVQAVKNANKARVAASSAQNTYKLTQQETVTEEDIFRLEMQIASIIDPTGVAGALASYTYPTCDKYFANGDARTNYTVYNDPHTNWVPWQFYSDKRQPRGAFIGGYEGNRPLRICRAQNPAAPGAKKHDWHPGKIFDGKCNFTWGGNRIVNRNYETLVNRVPLIWVPSSHKTSLGGQRQPNKAIIAAFENKRPLRICKALYNGVKHPGKIYDGRCEFAIGSRIERNGEYDVLIPKPTSLPDGFHECGKEGETCYFTGTVSAFYGDGRSKWQITPKKASFTCNAQAFGGDPAPNVAKACYVPENSITVLPYNYIECAKDNEPCTTKAVTDGGDIYYGEGQRWLSKPVSGGTFSCSSDYFDGNPAPGVAKSCYIPDYAIAQRPVDSTRCAANDEVCTVQGTRDVYYGAGNVWKVRSVTDSTFCIPAVFNDAGTGQGKSCYVRPQVQIPDAFIDNAKSGFDRPGSDYKNYRGLSQIQCQSACADDSRCRAWLHNPDSNMCYLKDPAPDLVDISSWCPNCATGLNPTLMSAVESGSNRPESNYRYFYPTTANPDMCQTACANENRCESWAYVASQKICYLKNAIPARIPGQSANASGVRLKPNSGDL